jgi:DnaJ-class molecular chaperone
LSFCFCFFSFTTKEFADAYEVLTSSALRAAYQQYGSEAIKKGKIPEAMGFKKFVPSQPEVIYEQFFGTKNPHSVRLVPEDSAFVTAATPAELQPPQPITM